MTPSVNGSTANFGVVAIRARQAPAADQAINADNNHKSFLIVNVGKPGENPWFDRLPRHSSELATRSIKRIGCSRT